MPPVLITYHLNTYFGGKAHTYPPPPQTSIILASKLSPSASPVPQPWPAVSCMRWSLQWLMQEGGGDSAVGPSQISNLMWGWSCYFSLHLLLFLHLGWGNLQRVRIPRWAEFSEIPESTAWRFVSSVHCISRGDKRNMLNSLVVSRYITWASQPFYSLLHLPNLDYQIQFVFFICYSNHLACISQM